MRTTGGLLWIGIVFALFVNACESLTVRQHFARYGMPRASHELDCPTDQLELVELDQPLDQPLMSGGTLVGVTGCSHRAVYVATNNGTWILNSVTNGVDKAPASKGKADKHAKGAPSPSGKKP